MMPNDELPDMDDLTDEEIAAIELMAVNSPLMPLDGPVEIANPKGWMRTSSLTEAIKRSLKAPQEG